MRFKPHWYVLLMLAVFVGYSLSVDSLFPPLGLESELSQRLFEKWLFVALLVGCVRAAGLIRKVGLTPRANWRTLPLYWPLALILGLIWLRATGSVSATIAMQLLALTIAVGIGEELMFRGLVFHWCRDKTVRTTILISASSFGAIHLTGLASDIHPAVIVSQVYFAFALGLVFACARARDVSIWIPIGVHSGFDFLAFLARGGVTQTFHDVGALVAGMLFTGTITLVWGLVLLRKAAHTQRMHA